MSKGAVYLLDSASGSVVKIESPRVLEGLFRPAEYFEIAKAVSEPPSQGSKRLRDKYGATLDGVLCASRPFDFFLYAYAATLNTYHSRAVRAKAKDIVGRAWQIVGEGTPALKERITSFFRNAFGGDMTFGEGMTNVWTDYEALGNGYLEVVPNAKGEPAELAQIPATEVWIRLDGLGFVQQKNGEYAHFRRFGVDPKLFADLKTNDPLRPDADKTSLIHFSRYFPWSQYYGIPPIMPAWPRMALMVLEAEYNLSFFNNAAIPDYAVILEGEWGDKAEETIKEYFVRHLKGQAHKTLCLTTPNGGKVTFEKLTSDNAKEGSFRLLRIDCRDEIIHAHGVPPQKVGIVETGKLGGNLSSEQAKEYKDSIVRPGQEKVTARLNKVIEAFGTQEFTIQFTPIDTEDELRNAQVDHIHLQDRVLVPNEVRAKRHPDLEPLVDGDEPLGGPSVNDLAGIDGALQQVQREVREAITK